MQKINYWVAAARPKTLTAAFVPILVATSLAVFVGRESAGSSGAGVAFSFLSRLWIPVFALVSSLFIQVGTNLINDAFDFKKGTDNKIRVGPQRATQMGWFSERQVLAGGFICFALAALTGVPLVVQGGWPIILVGLCSLAAGYAYTAGPFPLAYKGWGEVFVLLFFGLVAVLGTQYLLMDTVTLEGVWTGLQVGSLSTVLICINNCRDIENDRQSHKWTLAARWGEKFARREIVFFLLLPFVINLFWLLTLWMKLGVWKLAFLLFLLPFLLFPKVMQLLRQLQQTPWAGTDINNGNIHKQESYLFRGVQFNQVLGQAAQIQLLFGILQAVVFLSF